MNSSQSTCSEDMEFDFKNIVACEKENLYNMKRQLESFDMDTDDGDESQIIIQEMSPGTKKADNSNWQVLNDQIRDQMEKINKYSIMEYEWELKQNELQNVINHMTTELKCQKCNENTLISKIEDYEKILKCTQKELCDNQVKLEEQNCEIKKLCITRKTNEEEICKLRGQLCHSTKESDRLIENIKGLTEDLTYAKTEIKAQKLCIATMEENIKNDRETFSCELKNKCKKLKEMKTLYEETKCQLDQETCKTKNLVLALNDLNKTNEKNSCDLRNCLLESKTERCVKDSTICKLENEIEELQQQNELKDIALRYNLNDCQSEQMRVFSEKLCKFKQKYVSNLCQDKKIQKPTCCNVKTTCCSTQTKCCKVEKCCENLKTVTKICCKNMNTPQNCEPICPPICEQKCKPKCEPNCPLICEPKCPPKCEPKCPPKCEPKCPPKCEPKCPPKCPPKCEQKCPLKCEKSCNSCNNTDSNDLICKLSNLKKDIETLRMK